MSSTLFLDFRILDTPASGQRDESTFLLQSPNRCTILVFDVGRNALIWSQ